MNKVREQKNEMRRKYRAALRSSQPKETIIQLASAYHRLVRGHNRIRRQKESHDLQSRMRKTEGSVQITSGNLLVSCWTMIAIMGHLHLSWKQKPPLFFTETNSSQCQQPFQIPSWMKPRELPAYAFDTGNISVSEITT